MSSLNEWHLNSPLFSSPKRPRRTWQRHNWHANLWCKAPLVHNEALTCFSSSPALTRASRNLTSYITFRRLCAWSNNMGQSALRAILSFSRDVLFYEKTSHPTKSGYQEFQYICVSRRHRFYRYIHTYSLTYSHTCTHIRPYISTRVHAYTRTY